MMHPTHRQSSLQQYLDSQLQLLQGRTDEKRLPPEASFDDIQNKLRKIQNKLINLKNEAELQVQTNTGQQTERTAEKKKKPSATSLHAKQKQSSVRKTGSNFKGESQITPTRRQRPSQKNINQTPFLTASPYRGSRIKLQSRQESSLVKLSRQRTMGRLKFATANKQNKENKEIQCNQSTNGKTNYISHHQKQTVGNNWKASHRHMAYPTRTPDQQHLQRQIYNCHKANAELKKKVNELKGYESSYLKLRQVFNACEKNRNKQLFS